MRGLIELLLGNPSLFGLLALVWVVLTITGSIQRVRRQQSRGVARPGSQEPPRPSADEVAAEMRRALGLDPPPPPKPQRSPRPAMPSAVPPLPRSRPSRPVVTERPPAPLPTRELGKVRLGGSHVGERIEQRQAPQSGAVGAHELGGLGGRSVGRRPGHHRGGSLIDLHDLARVMVLREVIDRPLALRDREF